MAFASNSLCKMLLVLLRECFDVCEGAASFGGKVQRVRTSIGFGPATFHELSRLESIQQMNEARSLDTKRLRQ